MSETTPWGQSGSLELSSRKLALCLRELEDEMVVRGHHDQLISSTTEPLCPSLTAQRAGHSNEGSVVREFAVPEVKSPEVACLGT